MSSNAPTVSLHADRSVTGPPREAQKIFPIKLTSAGEVDLARNARVMSGNRFKILTGIDPNITNVSCCRIPSDRGPWPL